MFTPAQKACLLRAARKELDMLANELDRMQRLNRRHMIGPIAAVEAEIDCLAAGVTELWNQPEGNSS
jgi:hypothetical protein